MVLDAFKAHEYAKFRHDDGNAYEVRILEIPALASSVLWLRGDGDFDMDVFIPFGVGVGEPKRDGAYLSRTVVAAQARSQAWTDNVRRPGAPSS